jgi:DNA-binding transcriptional LysR family regulator
MTDEAPRVRLRFIQKVNKDSAALRDGTVDLETGVIEETTSPELRARALFRDQFIGVVRAGHPLAEGEITPARYAAGKHIFVARRGIDVEKGLVDAALSAFQLEREIVVSVTGFTTALALARASDLIVAVPERHTENLRAGMYSFSLPVEVPHITVSMLWHPRMDGDQAHRWLRGCVSGVSGAGEGSPDAIPRPLLRIE